MTPDDLTVYEVTEAVDNSKGLYLKADADKEKKVEEKKESSKEDGSESMLKVLVNLDSEPKVFAVKLEVPKLSQAPEVPTVKPLVVKEKLEEEKKEEIELKKKRIEQSEKDKIAIEELRKEREKNKERRRKVAEENPLQKITKNEINKATNKIDKIISDIDNIKREDEATGQKVEDKVTGAIYDDISCSESSSDSMRNIWLDYLSEEVYDLFEELEEAKINLRSKIKELDSKTNKSIIKVNNIESDLETLKELLEKIKNYLNNSNNYQEIYKAIKCSID